MQITASGLLPLDQLMVAMGANLVEVFPAPPSPPTPPSGSATHPPVGVQSSLQVSMWNFAEVANRSENANSVPPFSSGILVLVQPLFGKNRGILSPKMTPEEVPAWLAKQI